MTTAKQAAGTAAADLVEPGMVLGLGTGSTVAYFLEALGARRLDVAGVPTSEATATRCRQLGIRLLGVDEVESVDLAVDGADELTPSLALTKGGGGALLREKVIASMAARFVVIATPDKVVARLGDTFPLPVEVVPFAVPHVERQLRAAGATEVRLRQDGALTDNGLPIVDARFPGGIEDPDVLAVSLSLTPGVAEHGLFVDMADAAILGQDDGEVQHLTIGDL